MDKISTVGLFILTALLTAACGGGGDPSFLNFSAPNDILLAPSSYQIDGKVRRLGLVTNSISGTLTAIDIDAEKVLDLDRFDKRRTPIAVGGRAVSLAVQKIDSAEVADRIYVADQQNSRIVLVDLLKNSVTDDRVLRYRYGVAGPAEVRGASKPVFENKGRLSTPRIGPLTVSPTFINGENWRLKFKSKNYLVEGSRSGEQLNRAVEGETYTSDDGTISFQIDGGAEKTNNGDNFTFSTFNLRPLQLGFKPRNVFLDGSNLVVVDGENGAIVIYDSTSFALQKTVVLNDGSGMPVIPHDSFLLAGSVYVLNAERANLIRYDIVGDTQVTVALAGRPRYAFADLDDSRIFVLVAGANRLVVLDPLTNTLTADSIEFPSQPDTGVAGNFGYNVATAAVVTKEDGIYLIDLTTLKRVDLAGDGIEESDATRPVFQDVAPVSNPSITSVTTRDGITRSQIWTIVYEGVIPRGTSTAGALAGNMFTDAGQLFQTRKVIAGDLLVIPAQTGISSQAEFEIGTVVDETTLQLTADSGLNLAGLTYQIRAKQSFVVFGNLSGTQAGRAKIGQSYTSDDSEISFSVLQNVSKPLSRDDLYTFRTIDGVNAISVRGANPVKAIPVANASSSRDFLWTAFSGSDTVSVIDMLSERERISID